MKKLVVVAALAAVPMAPAAAGTPVPKDFQVVFGQRVHRGAYAVITQEGLPTTPVHGADGKQVEAYYSVDVKGGDWKPSTGFMDLNQVQTSTLQRGEVMEVVDVTYKDDGRIDVRLVTVEPHEVLRPKSGKGLEPASTNLKFFFPFRLRSAYDVPAALGYLRQYLQVFPGLDLARAYAAPLRPDTSPSAPAPGMVKALIKPGMTPLEVLDALGKPRSEVSSGARAKWTYPDLSVVFENGRVKEVVF